MDDLTARVKRFAPTFYVVGVFLAIVALLRLFNGVAAVLPVVHIIVCVLLVASILMQASKGGGLAGLFGGGGAETILGARGGTLLGKVTAGLFISFILSVVILGYVISGDTGAVGKVPGTEEKTPTPGAARSTSPPPGLIPPDENSATSSAWSMAATARTEGELAGAPTGATRP